MIVNFFWLFMVNCTSTIMLHVVKGYNQRAEKTGYDILTVAFWVSENYLKHEIWLLSCEQMPKLNRKKAGG